MRKPLPTGAFILEVKISDDIDGLENDAKKAQWHMFSVNRNGV